MASCMTKANLKFPFVLSPSKHESQSLMQASSHTNN